MEPNVCRLKLVRHSIQIFRPIIQHQGLLTRHKDVLIVGHEILQNPLGTIDNINVTPVDPRVIGLQSRVEQVVAGTTNGLAPGTLRSESMSLLDAHLDAGTKVLANNGGAAEADFFVGVVLDAIQLGGQIGQGVILAVADKESEIDQLVRVGQLVQEVEVFLEVGGSVAQRGQDEHALTVGHGLGRGGDGVQVDFGDGGVVHFVGFVVVEEDGGLRMGVPLDHLVEGHLHGGFGGAIAVETKHTAVSTEFTIYQGYRQARTTLHTFAFPRPTC